MCISVPVIFRTFVLLALSALILGGCTSRYVVGLQPQSGSLVPATPAARSGGFDDITNGNCTVDNEPGCIETPEGRNSIIAFTLADTACDGGAGTLALDQFELGGIADFGGSVDKTVAGFWDAPVDPSVVRDFGAEATTGLVGGIIPGATIVVENDNSGRVTGGRLTTGGTFGGYTTQYRVRASCSSNGSVFYFDPPIKNPGGGRTHAPRPPGDF